MSPIRRRTALGSMSPSISSSPHCCGLISRRHRVIDDDVVNRRHIQHQQHIHQQLHHRCRIIISSFNDNCRRRMMIPSPSLPHHSHHGFALQSRENRDRLRAQDKALRSMEEERQHRRLTNGDASRRWKMSNIHRVFITEIARQNRQRIRAQDKAKHEMDEEKQRRINHLASMFPSSKAQPDR